MFNLGSFMAVVGVIIAALGAGALNTSAIVIGGVLFVSGLIIRELD